MCGDITLFQSLTPLNPSITIHLPNDSKVDATKCGNIKLSPHLTLTNDLRNKFVLAVGKRIGKLYFLTDESFPSNQPLQSSGNILACNSDASQLYDLWHKRLGHCSSSALHHITVLNLSNENHTSICPVCPLAKQTRGTFSLSESHTCKPFELIHVDVWGPYKQPSLNGCHYILTIVDDYTRVTWTHLMHHKSQTTQILSAFFAKVSTQFETKVKALRSDNGSEFLSLSCQSLLQNLGIIHQKSCTYTPQQNGVVERKHRHLLQVARAIMFESGLPRIFWADSILVATHIINKLPSSKLNWKTPFELLYKSPPSYACLKTFGCLCYATNVMPHKSKFDHRAFKCVFIGYVSGQKGYKVYDIDNKVAFVSRDVVFHEDTFPYKSSTVQNR
ncbi:UNVERIFIED_CONTAM: putative mitochondrial protein [Sesamum radiatum]|uniref:Mitochondrial protein n=1 Tax=Sesamum radiatum TaxID=300843 RepID=A0AAW2PJW7_SESRA